MDNKALIINETINFVKDKMYKEGSGHDWFHVKRVYNMSKHICEFEEADNFVVEMAALLHDIDDWKFSDVYSTKTTEDFLGTLNLSMETKENILNIIRTMSFKGGVVDSSQHTIEGKIVQDADRLDAIGAIGIARTFAYGGSKGSNIYDPNILPQEFKSLDDVKSKENHTINHFYEKLLKLKDLMNTKKAKEIARKRHIFMEEFLEEFYSEWNIK